MKEIGYVIKYASGEYVAIDRESGGYPYPVEGVKNAEYWLTREGAKGYKDMFPNENWTLHSVSITERIIEWP